MKWSFWGGSPQNSSDQSQGELKSNKAGKFLSEIHPILERDHSRDPSNPLHRLASTHCRPTNASAFGMTDASRTSSGSLEMATSSIRKGSRSDPGAHLAAR